MGLIHLSRGIQTQRGYAPSDIARSAADSVAPWAWDGLICYLPLIEGRGLAKDHSLNNLPVAAGDVTPGWALSRLGWSGRFDTTANEQLVITDDAGGLRRSAPYSAVIWLKATRAQFWNWSSGIGPAKQPISNDNASTSSGWWFGRVGNDNAHELRFGTNSGNIRANVSNDDVDGVWTQVVLNQIAASDAEVWINGQRNVAGNNGFDGPNTDTKIEIGRRPESSEAYQGLIGPVMFFNRALSEAEIRGLYSDPFLPLRRRPLLVPVSATSTGPTTPTNLTTTDITANSFRANWT